jgi:hypothetical protein
MDELQTAIQNKNLAKVNELLENPAIVSTLNTKRIEDGKSYLYFAISNNVNDDILHALIDKGADINFIYTDEDGLQIPVFKYLLLKQSFRMEYDNIIIEFIRRGVRNIPWYDESIGILIAQGSVPNPENYRYPVVISPDLITSESVTVTYMEYNSEEDSYAESQPIHMSKEIAFRALNKDYGRKHGDLHTIKWENNILQTYGINSAPDIPVLIHFKYFEHSRLDYAKQYVVHKKLVNPTDPRNPSSYYPSPDIEICNIYFSNHYHNELLLFGTHIKFFDAPTIHTIVSKNSDNYLCIPDRNALLINLDKTWSVINDRPIREISVFNEGVFSSDMITVDTDPPVNRETAMSLLNFSDKMNWTSPDGSKFNLIITRYRGVSEHYFNFFNFKNVEHGDLFAILEWDQNGTDIEINPLYLYKNIKNIIRVDYDILELDADDDTYFESEEFRARMVIESKIRILMVYHIGSILKKYFRDEVADWLVTLPGIPNYRLNNRWERKGHTPVFPTNEDINTYFLTLREDAGVSRDDILLILKYYGILILPQSTHMIVTWLSTLAQFPTYPLNNKWERDGHPPVYPTNEEITAFLAANPVAGGGGAAAAGVSRDDIIMILKYYGIYIQPPLPTNFEEEVVSDCAICMNQKNYNIKSMNNPHRVVVLTCGDTFHKHCIEQYHAGKLANIHLQHQQTIGCPLCRVAYYRYHHATPYTFKAVQLGGTYYEKFQKYKAKINLN